MELVDWGMRFVMILVTIGVFVWGRTQKQTDDLLNEKTRGLRQAIADAAVTQDKTLLLQLAVRDQQLLSIHSRLDQAGQKSSDEANRVMVKINDLDHRLVRVETRLTRLSP